MLGLEDGEKVKEKQKKKKEKKKGFRGKALHGVGHEKRNGPLL